MKNQPKKEHNKKNHPLKMKCPYCLKQKAVKWVFPWQMPMHIYYKHGIDTLIDWSKQDKWWTRSKEKQEEREMEKIRKDIYKDKGWES